MSTAHRPITPLPTDAAEKAAVIRCLNDRFRRHFAGGRILLTAGVDGLEPGSKVALLAAVRQFDKFGENNDPFSEHDFGAVEIEGVSFFWKIEYYDTDLHFGSPDPADEAVTCRVMTIMRADEY